MSTCQIFDEARVRAFELLHRSPRLSLTLCFSCVSRALSRSLSLSHSLLARCCGRGMEFQMVNSNLRCPSMIASLIGFFFSNRPFAPPLLPFRTPLSLLSFSPPPTAGGQQDFDDLCCSLFSASVRLSHQCHPTEAQLAALT